MAAGTLAIPGAVAQLVERHDGIVEVARSNRVSSTQSVQHSVTVTPHSYDRVVAVTTPTEIGARAEAAVASALVRMGKPVFLPAFGVNSRIDLIYEDDGVLVRVQCKTSRIVGEVLVFPTCSHTKNMRRYYAGEIDVFGVYSPAQNLVYLVPTSGVPKGYGSLRIAPTRNGQRKGVWWADDFLLGPP